MQVDDHVDIFFIKLVKFFFEEHGKSSPINSTQYAKLYPQNGNRIVTIDSVTSFHPVYYRATLCYRSAVCVSVCPSVASRYCIEITGRIEMVFWRGYFLPSSPHCALRKFRYLLNNGTFLWDFVPNSGLRIFCHGNSIILLGKLVVGRAC